MNTSKRETLRLQKYLAQCGIASRRKAEELIQDGKIQVNGAIVTELGTQIDPDHDTVLFDGHPVRREERRIVLVINKPTGVLSSVTDDRGRKTVTDLVSEFPERLVPVGRLDYLSSGLLILTNDGALCNQLTHPRHHVPKTYRVRIRGVFTETQRRTFESGMEIDGYRTRPAQCRILRQENDKATLEITLHEGRNRQIRKMLEQLGVSVVSLERTAIGPLKDPSLKSGEYRMLSEKEILALKGE